MNRKLTVLLSILTIAALVPLGASADCGKDHDKAAMKAESPCAMAAKNQEKMQTMRAEMDARLQNLVDRMMAAEGAEKVKLMEATIAELVAQRSTCQMHMMKMQETAHAHAMHHMQHPEKAGDCPMAKAMVHEHDEGEDTAATH